MIQLTTEENQSYQKQKVSIYAKKNLVLMTKNTIKSDIIVITLGNIEVLLIIFPSSDIKHQRRFQ